MGGLDGNCWETKSRWSVLSFAEAAQCIPVLNLISAMASEYLLEFLFDFTLCDEPFLVAMIKHTYTHNDKSC